MDTAIENVRLSVQWWHTSKTVDGSLYGQLCSLTLEAIQSFGLASSDKHSGKHNSPGGEGLAGYRHGCRAASAPASRTAAVSLGTPFNVTNACNVDAQCMIEYVWRSIAELSRRGRLFLCSTWALSADGTLTAKVHYNGNAYGHGTEVHTDTVTLIVGFVAVLTRFFCRRLDLSPLWLVAVEPATVPSWRTAKAAIYFIRYERISQFVTINSCTDNDL